MTSNWLSIPWIFFRGIGGIRQYRQGPAVIEYDDSDMPCAVELHEAGIDFKVSEVAGLGGAISFRGGVLISIPKIFLLNNTDNMLLNLMALERLHPGAGNDVMAFVYFMDNLIDTAKDVAVLKSKGILQSGNGNDDEVARLILSKGLVMRGDSSIIDVLREVKAHRKKLWNTWRASFIHTYCSSPWVFISVITAFIILAATIMQTVYTIVPFYKG